MVDKKLIALGDKIIRYWQEGLGFNLEIPAFLTTEKTPEIVDGEVTFHFRFSFFEAEHFKAALEEMMESFEHRKKDIMRSPV